MRVFSLRRIVLRYLLPAILTLVTLQQLTILEHHPSQDDRYREWNVDAYPPPPPQLPAFFLLVIWPVLIPVLCVGGVALRLGAGNAEVSNFISYALKLCVPVFWFAVFLLMDESRWRQTKINWIRVVGILLAVILACFGILFLYVGLGNRYRFQPGVAAAIFLWSLLFAALSKLERVPKH